MKATLQTVIFLLALIATSFAGAVIVEFSAEPQEGAIRIYWKTTEEENVDLFIVQRSTNNRDFVAIGDVAAMGSNSEYEFVDSNLSGLQNVFYYRLRIRHGDGGFQNTESISVITNISSFARTWGTIKALFQ